MDSDERAWKYQQYVANSLNGLPENKKIPSLLKDIIYPEPIDTRPVEVKVKEITENVQRKTGIRPKEQSTA